MTLQLPDKHELDTMHLEDLLQFVDARDSIEFFKPAGQHYRLLSWLSTQYNDIEIFDIGTWHGSSAVALSHNHTNTVISFDIEAQRNNPKVPFNVAFLLGDILDTTSETYETYWKRLLKSPFICFDIHDKDGVHTGIPEKLFHDRLVKAGYSGTVFYDDIHLTEGMKAFWNDIIQEKHDLTSIGHNDWNAGSGLVRYGYKKIADLAPMKLGEVDANGRPKNWVD